MISLVLGGVVFIGLSAYADFNDVIDGLGNFKWQYLPIVLGLTSVNYLLRFLKWQYYLKVIGVRDFSARDSALVYFAGLGMVITPGKVGEWLKCYLLRETHGTPFSRSAPIVIAERLTDSLGLVILGSAGLVVFGDAWPAFVVVLAGAGVMFYVVRNRPLSYWLLHHLERVPVVSRFAQHAEEFYTSSYVLLSPVALGSMTLLSVLSWGFEVLAFYVVLIGLGVDGGADTLLKASFIMPAATLASVAADPGRPRCGRGWDYRSLAGPPGHGEVGCRGGHAFDSIRHALVRRHHRSHRAGANQPPSWQASAGRDDGCIGEPGAAVRLVGRILPADPASRAASLSVYLNVGLVVLKVSVGIGAGSVAVLSDGIDSDRIWSPRSLRLPACVSAPDRRTKGIPTATDASRRWPRRFRPC